MHFFLYNFSCKAKYLEGKMKHRKTFVSNLDQTPRKKFVVAYIPNVMHSDTTQKNC